MHKWRFTPGQSKSKNENRNKWAIRFTNAHGWISTGYNHV